MTRDEYFFQLVIAFITRGCDEDLAITYAESVVRKTENRTMHNFKPST